MSNEKKGLAAILSSVKTKPHVIELEGESIEFYPVRLRALLAAQSVVADMAQAAVGLFDPNKGDYTKKIVAHQEINVAEEGQPKDIVPVETTTIDAISPVHAKERIKRRKEDLSEGIKALLDEDNIHRVLLLIEDSSRGVCDTETLENATTDVILPLLRATLTANMSVFGGAVGKAMRAKLDEALVADELSPE